MDITKKMHAVLNFDMADYPSEEQINSAIVNTEKALRTLGQEINYIILDDNVTGVRYILRFHQFSEEFLTLINHIFRNKGLKHFSYVRAKKLLDGNADIQETYFEGQLILFVKTITDDVF